MCQEWKKKTGFLTSTIRWFCVVYFECVYGWSLPLTTITRFYWFVLFSICVSYSRSPSIAAGIPWLSLLFVYHFCARIKLTDWLQNLIFYCLVHVLSPNMCIHRYPMVARGVLSLRRTKLNPICFSLCVCQFESSSFTHSFSGDCLFCISNRFMSVIFPQLPCFFGFIWLLEHEIAWETFDHMVLFGSSVFVSTKRIYDLYEQWKMYTDLNWSEDILKSSLSLDTFETLSFSYAYVSQ